MLALATPSQRLVTAADARQNAAPINPASDVHLADGLELRIAPHAVSAAARAGADDDPPYGSLATLRAAVDVCTKLNRARDLDELNDRLGDAATVIDASGLIVWLGSAAGASLRPVLANGYSERALARMPLVARSEDNAAAAAYRTGELQIVRAQPGLSSGALAAPMLSRDGCIGALTAEIRNGGESAPQVQAMAAILAAQLAGILADSVAAEGGIEESKTASA
jgi:hypothetical protein